MQDRTAVSAAPDTWTRILRVWPLDMRPAEMQDRSFVNSFSFDQAIVYKEHYLEELKRQGKGDSVFGRDAMPPTRRYAGGEDNCADKLCPIRYLTKANLKTGYKRLVPVPTFL